MVRVAAAWKKGRRFWPCFSAAKVFPRGARPLFSVAAYRDPELLPNVRDLVAWAGAPAALSAAIFKTVSDGMKSPAMEGVPNSAVPGCIPGRMTQAQRCTAGETASLVIRYPV